MNEDEDRRKPSVAHMGGQLGCTITPLGIAGNSSGRVPLLVSSLMVLNEEKRSSWTVLN